MDCVNLVEDSYSTYRLMDIQSIDVAKALKIGRGDTRSTLYLRRAKKESMTSLFFLRISHCKVVSRCHAECCGSLCSLAPGLSIYPSCQASGRFRHHKTLGYRGNDRLNARDVCYNASVAETKGACSPLNVFTVALRFLPRSRKRFPDESTPTLAPSASTSSLSTCRWG